MIGQKAGTSPGSQHLHCTQSTYGVLPRLPQHCRRPVTLKTQTASSGPGHLLTRKRYVPVSIVERRLDGNSDVHRRSHIPVLLAQTRRSFLLFADSSLCIFVQVPAAMQCGRSRYWRVHSLRLHHLVRGSKAAMPPPRRSGRGCTS